MSEIRNDGGPAFPQAIFHDEHAEGESFVETKGGMTLRDWFAGQALQGALAARAHHDVANEIHQHQRENEMHLTVRQTALETNKRIAAMVYEIADAILAERAK